MHTARLGIGLLAAFLITSWARPAEAAAPQAPILLFDGKSLDGWSFVNSKGVELSAVCQVTPEGIMTVVGKPVGYLLTSGTYANYTLHVEWRWPANAAKSSNGGILVHISTGPIDRGTWPCCIQVQTKLQRAGDLILMGGATFAEPLSSAPGAQTLQLDRRQPSSERPLGEWNVCDVVCRDGTLECTVNGVKQNRVTGCKPASGKIGLQLEGTPWELRSFQLQPLP